LTFVWKHPKFYKPATNCRRDNKPQKEEEDEISSNKQQDSSNKRPETKSSSD